MLPSPAIATVAVPPKLAVPTATVIPVAGAVLIVAVKKLKIVFGLFFYLH